MSSRLHKIEIHNFKAFREFAHTLEGRHLLAYGANGTGKSSLYWALYTFLQSARKPQRSIEKYFSPGGAESLLNVHEPDPVRKPGEIAVTVRHVATKHDTTYRISRADHDTRNQPVILKGDLASDFITYRFVFGFSHLRNSEQFDIWPIFMREILPFCVSTSNRVPSECWSRIAYGDPNPSGKRGVAGQKAYKEFAAKVAEFADILDEVVESISRAAQTFYDEHFAYSDAEKLELGLAVATRPSCKGGSQSSFRFTHPVIECGIRAGGKPISRPQTFLNEAKLTQLALSVRFAASLVNLHDSDIKLLVLDDLLVSLDMSNRMKVVQILLSESFEGYQKIILTHDLGFFREFRRTIGADHADWSFVRFEGAEETGIACKSEKSDLEKAEDYLSGHNLDEAAVCLRKAAEEMATRYREWTEQRKLPPGKFFTLTENLRAARNRLMADVPLQVYQRILRDTPIALREHLVPSGDGDLDAQPALTVKDRGILKTQRKKLRTFVTDDNWRSMEKVELIDELIGTTARVLNAGAHAGSEPLYRLEIEKALVLIKNLQQNAFDA